MFIGFCRRKLNKGKLDQINSELAQSTYSDYWAPNQTTYLINFRYSAISTQIARI
jgi:hypothetical protein